MIAMARNPIPAFLFILFATIFSVCLSSTNQKLSAYQVLQHYNFPVGILPEGVTGYTINPQTGEFEAYLNGTCEFTIQSYNLKYKSKITGKISTNKITDLKGVSVKVLFFWLNIVEVIRSSDELQFSVGIASADFPLDSFYESPQCGCGFDCNRLDNHGFLFYA